MSATVVALVSDLHCNSTTALCPPVVDLDDRGQYHAGPIQRAIWRHWLAYWKAVKTARAGKRLVIVLNGELADNNHHPTSQLVTRNPADMLKLSAEALAPALALLGEDDRIFVTRGTEAHSGGSAYMDETVANDIGATGPGDDLYSHWQLRLDIEGVRFDIAHHPPGGGGRVPWTRGNFAGRLAAMSFYEAIERNEKPPHLYVRGHVHRPGDSYDLTPVRALILPSWQHTTSYGYRIGGGDLPIGGAIVTCSDGRYMVDKMYYHWPRRQYVTV